MIELVVEPYGTAPNMEPADDTTVARWEQQLTEALDGWEAEGTTGAWVAISLPATGFWCRAAGTTSAGGPAASLGDHSRIGSVTKTITATAVLEQVAADALSLDQTVADVLPDVADRFPPTARVTVRQLLAMDSGLPDYANVRGGAFTRAVDDPARIWTPEDLVGCALEAGEPAEPGTPGYSTTGYAVLALVLERLTGRPAHEVITDVARRAGLEQTVLAAPDDNTMPEPYVRGYQDRAGVVDMRGIGIDEPVGTDFTDLPVASLGGAGGGAYSTIGDLFNWAASGSGTSLLARDLAEQRTDLRVDIPGVGRYGLGLLAPFHNGLIGHTGQSLGYEAVALHHPGTGATVAMMANSTDGLGGLLAAFEDVVGGR
ncbi:MAG: serine hydrolase domain-containing protein [Nocardioides sp.]